MLLTILAELRDDHVLVITHQKRTMAIADGLYGVAMRNDGVTTVIGQKLRDGLRRPGRGRTGGVRAGPGLSAVGDPPTVVHHPKPPGCGADFGF